MHKRLQLLIPAVQLLICIVTFSWYRFIHSDVLLLKYAVPARDIVMKLNFPLMILWAPFSYGLDRLFSAPYREVTLIVGAAIVGVALFSNIALFWYFVV